MPTLSLFLSGQASPIPMPSITAKQHPVERWGSQTLRPTGTYSSILIKPETLAAWCKAHPQICLCPPPVLPAPLCSPSVRGQLTHRQTRRGCRLCPQIHDVICSLLTLIRCLLFFVGCQVNSCLPPQITSLAPHSARNKGCF